jgi:large subunit ribosomal protein L3
MLGLIGTKVGMTQVFDEQGTQTPVTVIQIDANTVVGRRTAERDGYSAVILGYGAMKKNRVRKPYSGQFPEGLEPAKVLKEVKDFERDCKVGDSFGVETFEGTVFVDVQGVSKGKGFQGAMKRHGFGGGPKSHGSLVHREIGSGGVASGKSFKGARMPGRMGGASSKVQNLLVVRIDAEKGVMLVKGAVPGRRGGQLFVAKARKK